MKHLHENWREYLDEEQEPEVVEARVRLPRYDRMVVHGVGDRVVEQQLRIALAWDESERIGTELDEVSRVDAISKPAKDFSFVVDVEDVRF